MQQETRITQSQHAQLLSWLVATVLLGSILALPVHDRHAGMLMLEQPLQMLVRVPCAPQLKQPPPLHAALDWFEHPLLGHQSEEGIFSVPFQPQRTSCCVPQSRFGLLAAATAVQMPQRSWRWEWLHMLAPPSADFLLEPPPPRITPV